MAQKIVLYGIFDTIFNATLGDYQYRFTLYYNKAISRWVLDCQDRNSQVVLFSGAPINVGVDMFVNLDADRGHLINVGYGNDREVDVRDLSNMQLTWFPQGV